MEETKKKPRAKAKTEAPKKEEVKKEPEERLVKKTVKPARLNIRTSPDTETKSNILYVLRRGDVVEVVTNAQCPIGWSFVKADIPIGKVKGYVMTEYIK